MSNADAATFEVKGTKFIDKNHVFVNEFSDGELEVFEDAKPATLKALSNGWYTDEYNYYKGDDKADVEYFSFEILTPEAGIDQHKFYYFSGF